MTGSATRTSYPPPGAPPPEESPPARAGQPGPERSAQGAHERRAPPDAPAGSTGPPLRRSRACSDAAHKPGAIPLRPLTLGNIYDGAFRIIRFNPKATVGAAALVTAVAMVLPILVSTVSAFALGTGFEPTARSSDDASTAEIVGLLGSFGSLRPRALRRADRRHLRDRA